MSLFSGWVSGKRHVCRRCGLYGKTYRDRAVATDGDAAVAVAPAYQGRVMTSTFDRKSGPSFGWINRPVIEKGLLSDEEKKGKLEEHIYIFGGEERFWLGPEGGQYALFFKPGTEIRVLRLGHASGDRYRGVRTGRTDRSVRKVQAHDGTDQLQRHQVQGGHRAHGEAAGQTGCLTNCWALSSPRGCAWWVMKRTTGSPTQVPTPGNRRPVWFRSGCSGCTTPRPKQPSSFPSKKVEKKTLGPKVNDTYFGKVPPEYLKVEKQKIVLPRRRHAPGKDRHQSAAFEGDCRKLRCRRTGAQHRHLQRAGRTARIRQFHVGTAGRAVCRGCDQFLQRRFAANRANLRWGRFMNWRLRRPPPPSSPARRCSMCSERFISRVRKRNSIRLRSVSLEFAWRPSRLPFSPAFGFGAR